MHILLARSWIHDKWFVNLSNETIPDDVILLLQLGKRFNLLTVIKDNEKTVIEFIKSIEKNLFKEVDVISSSFRNRSIPIIKRMYKKQTILTTMRNYCYDGWIVQKNLLKKIRIFCSLGLIRGTQRWPWICLNIGIEWIRFFPIRMRTWL